MTRTLVTKVGLTVTCATVASLGAACSSVGSQQAGHGAVHGTVTGRFVREGGPLGSGGQQPAERPLAGLVQFISAGGRITSVRVGHSGTFSVSLLPGTYRVTGRSPDLIQASRTPAVGKRELPCSQPATVTVAPRRTAKVTVTCIVP